MEVTIRFKKRSFWYYWAPQALSLLKIRPYAIMIAIWIMAVGMGYLLQVESFVYKAIMIILGSLLVLPFLWLIKLGIEMLIAERRFGPCYMIAGENGFEYKRKHLTLHIDWKAFQSITITGKKKLILKYNIGPWALIKPEVSPEKLELLRSILEKASVPFYEDNR